MIHEIQLKTKRRNEMLDITAQVEAILVQENFQEGLCVVYSPHITAGITINENADPDVQKDILRRLDEAYPRNDAKDMHVEGKLIYSMELMKLVAAGFFASSHWDFYKVRSQHVLDVFL